MRAQAPPFNRIANTLANAAFLLRDSAPNVARMCDRDNEVCRQFAATEPPPGFTREQWERHCADTSEEADGHGDGIAASLHSQQCIDGWPDECPICNPTELWEDA